MQLTDKPFIHSEERNVLRRREETDLTEPELEERMRTRRFPPHTPSGEGWGWRRGGACDVRCARGSGCAGTAGAREAASERAGVGC